MNNKEITLNEMLKAIEDFQYLRQCFSDYLKWLFEECDGNRRRYDAVYVKIATGVSSLEELENDFQKFGEILDLNESDFCKAFRFDFDRNRNEILKLGDLMAEPQVALSLHDFGFQNIRKVSANKARFSDFIADWNTVKFAVEIKNARNADDEDFYKKRIDSSHQNEIVFTSELRERNGKDLSQQEEEILPNRLERRISTENERNKIINQLKNTSEKENCDATMIVIYLEMMSDLMPDSMIVHHLQKTKEKHSISDYFACSINGKLFCSPQLP